MRESGSEGGIESESESESEGEGEVDFQFFALTRQSDLGGHGVKVTGG